MTTDVTKPGNPMEEFKAKLAEKVRENIAGLLPEDAVNELVQEAVRETFFKERVIEYNNYHGNKMGPSWFVSAVRDAAKPILEKAVADFMAKPEARVAIQTALNEYLSPKNLTLIAVGALGSDIRMALDDLARAVQAGRFRS